MEEELEFLFINGEIITHKPKRQRKELKKILFDRLAAPLNIEYYGEIEDIDKLEEYMARAGAALSKVLIR